MLEGDPALGFIDCAGPVDWLYPAIRTHSSLWRPSTYQTLFKVRRITQSWAIVGAYQRVPVPMFYCSPTLPRVSWPC